VFEPFDEPFLNRGADLFLAYLEPVLKAQRGICEQETLNPQLGVAIISSKKKTSIISSAL
jgi:hypothetical protein